MPVVTVIGGAGRGNVPPAAPEIFVQDTFAEAANTFLGDHVPDIGDGWTEEERTGADFLRVVATDDAVRSTGFEADDRNVFSVAPGPSTADYHVTADMWLIDDTLTEAPVFLLARFASLDAFYACGVWSLAGSPNGLRMRILKRHAGSPSLDELAAATHDLDVTTPFTVRFECEGTTLRGYVNGGEILSVADADLSAAGKAGLTAGNLYISSDDMTASWFVDNFIVQALS